MNAETLHRTVPIMAIAAISLFLILGCSPGDDSDTAEEIEERLAVEVEEVEERGIQETIYLTGEIEPTTTVEIVPEQTPESHCSSPTRFDAKKMFLVSASRVPRR